MMKFTKYFNRYPGTFNVDLFFSFPVKLLEDFNVNLKFRSKFNRGFINHDCLDCAFQKAFYNFKVPRAHEARGSQFLFQNVQNGIFEIFKMLKNNLKLSSLLN